MAIDLLCYIAKDQKETQEVIERLRHEHGDLLGAIFLLYDANEVSDIGKTIALQYDFIAVSSFLMSLNIKDQLPRLKEAENIVKSAFGEENILILWENESKH